MKNWIKKQIKKLATPPKTSHKKGQRGLTLIEIMVVVVIIGLIGSVVGVQVFGSLSKARRDTAYTQIQRISEALQLYKLSHRSFPSTGEGLNALTQSKGQDAPMMSSIPKDPWGKDYTYIYPGTNNQGSFDLMSYGSDGVQGGGDDVTNWQSPDQQ
ncbi:type II secretion system major pseudopilin GspG [Myxococcota bacterium]|nr:type II secretion system major pseudopilin GspG [Myxococcota bacterium]